MFRPLRAALTLSGLVAINISTWIVTTRNQIQGIYDIESDSIGAPLIITLIVTATLLPLLLMNVFVEKKSLQKEQQQPRTFGILKAACGHLIYLLSLSICVYGAYYWNIPEHLLICASYVFLALVTFSLMVLDAVKHRWW